MIAILRLPSPNNPLIIFRASYQRPLPPAWLENSAGPPPQPTGMTCWDIHSHIT
jgi:hypothetical protein